MGYVPNNISGKPAVYRGEKPAYFLEFDSDGASIDGTNSKGWTWVYVIEILVGAGLIILYYFVALPGFESLFGDSSNPIAPVAGLSATYFLVAGLFEAYVLNPLLVKVLVVKATRTGQTDNSGIYFARAFYWTVVVGVYYKMMKGYLAKRKQAKPQE